MDKNPERTKCRIESAKITNELAKKILDLLVANNSTIVEAADALVLVENKIL